MSNDILDISLWPNSEGTLGNIKVAIPDGVTTKWPEGDALVENFVYKDGKLVGLVDTKALIENESKTTTFPYDYVDITVDKRLESLMAFNAGDRCKYLNVKYEVVLPEGYKRLAYLDSTGKQRIDTDFYPTSQSGVEMDFCVTEETSASSWFFGNGDTGRNDEPDKKFSLLYTHDRTYPRGLFYLGGDVAQNQIFALAGTRQLLKVANGIVSAGHGSMPAPTANFVGVTELTICSHVRQATAMRVRWYGCKLYENGEIKRDFVPALNPTGAPCMYDIMSGEPFYSETTDDFIYPNIEQQTSTYSLRNRMYAKMTEHGVQRLYHVPENYSGSKEDYASENGFKELVTSPMPTEGHWNQEWTETDTQLICSWTEVEEPIEA